MSGTSIIAKIFVPLRGSILYIFQLTQQNRHLSPKKPLYNLYNVLFTNGHMLCIYLKDNQFVFHKLR